MDSRQALAGRVPRNRYAAGLTVVVLLATMVFFWQSRQVPQFALTLTAGDMLGQRFQLAEHVRDEAARRGLTITIVPTAGTRDALRRLAMGEIDLALAQGGVDADGETIRQVAVLFQEPLHLFVRPQIAELGLSELKQRKPRLNLSTSTSGTRHVAQQALELMGMTAGRDYIDLDYSYGQLAELPDDQLPDGIFAVSTLPWSLGEELVHRRGYRLMGLPFADAMTLRDPMLRDMVIPRFSYSVIPPVPNEPIHTVASQLIVVARKETPELAVTRLMEVLFETDLHRHASLPPWSAEEVLKTRQFPIHPGAMRYLQRDQPAVTGEVIENAENLRSFLVSGAIAAFLLWRWYRRRRLIGFEQFFDAVTQIELEALDWQRHPTGDPAPLSAWRERLSNLKEQALERQAEGVLAGDDQMQSFLTHVADVRSELNALLLQQRDASATNPADERVRTLDPID